MITKIDSGNDGFSTVIEQSKDTHCTIIPFHPNSNILVLVGCPKIPKARVRPPCSRTILRINPLTYSWMMVVSDALFHHLSILHGDVDWRKFHCTFIGLKP
mmetsp:Transcript_12634/g.19072  ORF Transcript_12634/g.19072 Transcript_12634/m.19072 type:complete len:101 (-) Transcript_12634:1435-1737(-)